MSSMDEFKKFVMKYPKLKEEVRNDKRSWQSIYEEWKLYGDDGSYSKYRDDSNNSTGNGNNDLRDNNSNDGTDDTVKQIIGYVKKLNPDNVTKTVSAVQKILSMVGTMNGGQGKVDSKSNNGFFNSKYNDWY